MYQMGVSISVHPISSKIFLQLFCLFLVFFGGNCFLVFLLVAIYQHVLSKVTVHQRKAFVKKKNKIIFCAINWRKNKKKKMSNKTKKRKRTEIGLTSSQLEKVSTKSKDMKLCFHCEKCGQLDADDLKLHEGEGIRCISCDLPVKKFATSEYKYEMKKFEPLQDDLLANTMDPFFEDNETFSELLYVKIRLLIHDFEENGEKIVSSEEDIFNKCVETNLSTEDEIIKWIKTPVELVFPKVYKKK